MANMNPFEMLAKMQSGRGGMPQMRGTSTTRGRGRGRGIPIPGYRYASMPPRIDFKTLETKYKVDPKKWRCIYTCYLDINKTIDEGRKVSKKYCCKDPHVNDIADVCKYLGLPYYIEYNKKHPRDFFGRGRVRVLLKDENDNNRRNDIKNRKMLLIALGKMIPKLESRKIRLQKLALFEQKRKEMIEKKNREAEQKNNERKKKQQNKQNKKQSKQRKNTKPKKGKGSRRGKGKKSRR